MQRSIQRASRRRCQPAVAAGQLRVSAARPRDRPGPRWLRRQLAAAVLAAAWAGLLGGADSACVSRPPGPAASWPELSWAPRLLAQEPARTHGPWVVQEAADGWPVQWAVSAAGGRQPQLPPELAVQLVRNPHHSPCSKYGLFSNTMALITSL